MELASILQNKIESKEIEGKLPTIRQLMKIYDISQSTAVKSLEILKSKKLIYVKKITVITPLIK